MTIRVSTYAQHNNAVSEFSRLQAELAKIQQQISSGNKASTFTELGTSLSTVIGLEFSINSADKFISSNNRIVSRLSIMDQSLQQLQNLASELQQNMPLERGSSGNQFNFTDFAKNSLQQVRDSLNTKQGGSSIFGGGKTNKDAVADLNLSTNIINGASTANYYQGDEQVFSIKASENLNISYGIKANDKVFQDLIAGYNKMMEYEVSQNDTDYEIAATFVENAMSGLISLRSGLGLDIQAIESSNVQHQSVSDLLSISLSDETGVDIVEATIQSSITEATLTASLQTFARISNLTLSDFLR